MSLIQSLLEKSYAYRLKPFLFSRKVLLNTFKAATGKDPLGFYPEFRDLKDFVKLFKNIVRPDLEEVTEQKNYLDAPWPQPSPHFPDSLAPTVLKVPPNEIKEFIDKIVSRYIRTLRFDWLRASRFVFEHPTVEVMTDDEIIHFFSQTMFGRFLNATLDTLDHQYFSAHLKDGKKYLKVDFTSMREVHCFKDFFAYTTVGLFEQSNTILKLKAIRVEDQVFTKVDGDFWKLAKLHLINGAAMNALLSVHPRVHFPMDAIAAITQSVLPASHLLYQLLKPHLYLQLPLNFAVLYVNKSLLRNNQNEIYTPFCGEISGALHLMKAGYAGITGNSSFPPYRFPLHPLKMETDYAEFLKSYDACVEKFVRKVLEKLPQNDPQIERWARHINQFIPGFPDAVEIHNFETLVRTVTSIIMDVSVIHSADHYSLSSVPINKMPLRIRLAMPRRGQKFRLDLKTVQKKQDIFRHFMAHQMYFQPSTICKLIEVDYHFDDAVLQDAQNQFKRDLKKTESLMNVRSYIPLKDIATSIQY